MVLLYKEFLPIATFWFPVVLALKLKCPIAILLLAVVLLAKAVDPKATFCVPVVFDRKE